jgi:hypothetical protein
MTVSRNFNPPPQGPKHDGSIERRMFSNLFSDAIFTKQGKRIRRCTAAWRSRSGTGPGKVAAVGLFGAPGAGPIDRLVC